MNIAQWFRNLYHRLLCLEIVYHPPLGRLGVWLCDRYESRRYRTRVENNLVVVYPPTTGGAFAPGGFFNIERRIDNLPPMRSRVPRPWFGVREHSLSVLERMSSYSRLHPEHGNRSMFMGWHITFSGVREHPNTVCRNMWWSAYPTDPHEHWSLHSCYPGDCRPYYDVSALDFTPRDGQHTLTFDSTNEEIQQCNNECLDRLKLLITKHGPPPFSADKYRKVGDKPSDLDIDKYNANEDDLERWEKQSENNRVILERFRKRKQ
jgi:hypothetical protein